MKRFYLIIAFLTVGLVNVNATIIEDVPAYNYTIGCGPTAAASVLGYHLGWSMKSSEIRPELDRIAQVFKSNNGWSFLNYSDDVFQDWGFDSYYERTNWDSVVASIDQGQPVLGLVDIGGDGRTDHFVSVFGYEFRDEKPWYAFYSGWSEAEVAQWEPFGLSQWNLMYSTFAIPGAEIIAEIGLAPEPGQAHPVPEPATIFLLGFGLIGLSKVIRKL